MLLERVSRNALRESALKPWRPRWRVALIACGSTLLLTGIAAASWWKLGALQVRAGSDALPSWSDSTAIAYISLGRLLLDQQEDSSSALQQFDHYLANHRDGALADEARVGRAEALEALNRSPEARATWAELQKERPTSMYGRRAEQKLRQLSGW